MLGRHRSSSICRGRSWPVAAPQAAPARRQAHASGASKRAHDPTTVTDSGPTRFGDLPYGPTMTRLLEPMHGAFIQLNRWFAVPALRAGLGPLFSTPVLGSLMVLRTTGRKSGLPRDVPLGYAILDGCVYCIAGFGAETQWFRNIQADPAVEVVLPTATFRGVAEEVTDPDEWTRAFRLLMTNLGPIGRATSGDVRGRDGRAPPGDGPRPAPRADPADRDRVRPGRSRAGSCGSPSRSRPRGLGVARREARPGGGAGGRGCCRRAGSRPGRRQLP